MPGHRLSWSVFQADAKGKQEAKAEKACCAASRCQPQVGSVRATRVVSAVVSDGRGGRTKNERSSVLKFTSPKATAARAGPDQSQETKTPRTSAIFHCFLRNSAEDGPVVGSLPLSWEAQMKRLASAWYSRSCYSPKRNQPVSGISPCHSALQRH